MHEQSQQLRHAGVAHQYCGGDGGDAEINNTYNNGADSSQQSHPHNQNSSRRRDDGEVNEKRRTRRPSLLARAQIASTEIPQGWVTPFCGAAAGVASGIVTCPLDVIKTKLQAQGGFANGNGNGNGNEKGKTQDPSSSAQTTKKPSGSEALRHGKGSGSPHTAGGAGSLEQRACRGMFGTGKLILREEGLRGFYRGLAPMLLGYLPTWAVYMTVYDVARKLYENEGGTGTANWWLSRMGASVSAGACSTIATNPIWVIKTRLMSQSIRSSSSSADAYHGPSWGYKGTLDACRKIYASEGMAAFYSGLTPALIGLSHVAIQFPLYEFFKMQFTGYEIGQAPDQSGVATNTHWLGISAATFLSKVCASTATYPHEVLRTRLQTQMRYFPPQIIGLHGDPGYEPSRSPSYSPAQPSSSSSPPSSSSSSSSSSSEKYQLRYRGVLQACKVILQEEGWRAFYAGIGTNLFRAIPSAMTTMLTYEYLKGVIGWMQREGESRVVLAQGSYLRPEQEKMEELQRKRN